MTLCGRCTRARASATFICWPREKPRARRSMKSSMRRRRDQLGDARVQLAPREPVQFAEIADVLARRQPRVQRAVVGQHAEPAARRDRVLLAVDAVDQRGAAVRPQHRADQAEHRGLAGAVRPDQPGDLAVARDEADVLDDPQIRRKILRDRGPRSSGFHRKATRHSTQRVASRSRRSSPSLGEFAQLAGLDIGNRPQRHAVRGPVHDIVALTLRNCGRRRGQNRPARRTNR